MNYDGLTDGYWRSQIERVEKLRAKISARPTTGTGLVVPDDDELTIGTGRRLRMAVMFIDICSFSNRPMESVEEQDRTLRILNLFFTEMIRIAEDYGGNVEKNTGDGLMIYFNDGEGDPPENGAKRALASALTMLAANEKLIKPILKASQTDEIQFRTSIDYGWVTVARLGRPRGFNSNAAIGATANFASKMMKHAGAGEIVIGETVYRSLPANWKALADKMPIATGWRYVADDQPYSVYRYMGRWSRLT